MAFGQRKTEHQQELFVAEDRLPHSPGRVFYRKPNELFAEADFDARLKDRCRPYYVDRRGREGIPPGTYFRMRLVDIFVSFLTGRSISGLPQQMAATPRTSRFLQSRPAAPSYCRTASASSRP
jgi:hypothetical protein